MANPSTIASAGSGTLNIAFEYSRGGVGVTENVRDWPPASVVKAEPKLYSTDDATVGSAPSHIVNFTDVLLLVTGSIATIVVPNEVGGPLTTFTGSKDHSPVVCQYNIGGFAGSVAIAPCEP